MIKSQIVVLVSVLVHLRPSLCSNKKKKMQHLFPVDLMLKSSQQLHFIMGCLHIENEWRQPQVLSTSLKAFVT